MTLGTLSEFRRRSLCGLVLGLSLSLVMAGRCGPGVSLGRSAESAGTNPALVSTFCDAVSSLEVAALSMRSPCRAVASASSNAPRPAISCGSRVADASDLEHDMPMVRRAWLSLVAIVVAVTVVFVLVWAIWGQGNATAAATIAAVPIAVAVAFAPPVLNRATPPVSPIMIMSGEDEGDRLGFRYESRNESGRIVITPRDPYLDLLRSGGRLTSPSFWYTPWLSSFKWPALDVKLVNNSDQTLVFHEAILVVNESRLDPRPVPIIKETGYDMSVPLINVGWGPMIDTTLRFELAPAEDADPVTSEFVWQVDDIDTLRQKGSMARFFADSGVDCEMLERLQIRGGDGNWHYISPTSGIGEPVPADDAPISSFAGLFAGLHRISEQEYGKLRRRALGPFVEGGAVMRGTLEYSQNDANGSQSRQANPFVAHVSFGPPALGAPMPPSWTYNMKLRSESSDYAVVKPISQTLKSGEGDRFLLNLSADRSSFHELSLKLIYNDGATLTSGRVSLELFVSTLDAHWMAKESGEIEQIAFD